MNDQLFYGVLVIIVVVIVVIQIVIFRIKAGNLPFEDSEQLELANRLGLDTAWGLIKSGDLVMGPNRTLKLVLRVRRNGLFLIDTFRDSMYGNRGVPTFLPIFKKPQLAEEMSPISRGKPYFEDLEPEYEGENRRAKIPADLIYLRHLCEFVDQQVNRS